MKYHSQLVESTLLKRPLSFLVEVVLPSKRRIMLRCPNLGPLVGCDILGTQLWFSAPSGDNCLPTLELAEVNGGFLVNINPETLKPLVMEAINLGHIPELEGYNLIPQETNYDQDSILCLILEKNVLQQAYVCLEHVIYSNEHHEGIFPLANKCADQNLDYLIFRKKQGNRAILLYCVLHAGVKVLKFSDQIDPEYSKKIAYAVSQGVEIIAYKANISIQEIKLEQKLPIATQVGEPLP